MITKIKKHHEIPTIVCCCLTLLFLFTASTLQAQQMLWFGTVKEGAITTQGRFEVLDANGKKSIIYAPYGISPVTFKNVKQENKRLTFSWLHNQLNYQCTLRKQEKLEYTGSCTCENGQPIELVMREFTNEDAILQGNFLPASQTDVQIIERAGLLLNKGTSWNRHDRRICDSSTYPYQWSLFCALHQASIDIDGQYRHLRPAIQAVRQAIEEATAGKKFAHLLQDFNNEAPSFEAIDRVLNRGREIITEKIKK